MQVHFLAEPEMVKYAYRKLAAKYHPDVSNLPSSQEKMKQIIRAYDTLSDPIKRKHYFMKWVEKNSKLHTNSQASFQGHFDPHEVKAIEGSLYTYLGHITDEDYPAAYDMLSKRDQEIIQKEDFIEWQQLVSEVYELVDYECQVKSVYQDILISDVNYSRAANVEVRTIEKNHLMQIRERDELFKSTVYEDNHWAVYLGRSDLKNIIAKFKELAKLKNKHKVYKIRTKKVSPMDNIPGLLNKNAFLESAKKEQHRYLRYGSPFSIILCEVIANDTKALQVDEELFKQVGVIIAGNLRELDFISRWQKRGFIILLAETDSTAAILAASRIRSAVYSSFEQVFEDSLFTLKLKIAQQSYDTFKELYNYLSTD